MGMTEQVDGYNVTFEERCITATRRFLDEPENEGTDEFDKVKSALSNGFKLVDVRKKYNVSKKVADLLTK